MNNKLAILGGKPVTKLKGPHFVWPIITNNLVKDTIKQLHTSISIYDKSGIINTFEEEFKKFHKKKFGLLLNSGTTALFAAYEAFNLQLGDEVLCPTYTFHATVSAMIYTGAKPVFCDCLDDGNIDPEEIKKKITSKTRLIVVTHMWGKPCALNEIKKIAEENKLFLLEDCSHAHGATYKNHLVGTFGDIAVWSLQGQKIITGGEGGILLTDNQNFYERAVLQGHYNKRCKQEISKTSHLYSFYLTGMGQKFRSHPLAVVIALNQFKKIQEILKWKEYYARKFIDLSEKYPFLEIKTEKNCKNSWYALIIHFNEQKANVNTKRFFDALLKEGLVEFDMPVSTMPIHDLPLFTETHKIMPRLYKEPIRIKGPETFPKAEKIYTSILKLPIWTTAQDKKIMNVYLKGLEKVCKNVNLLNN